MFTVKKDGQYRFRVVVASMTFAFRISIDGHKLHVVAADGSDVVDKVVGVLPSGCKGNLAHAWSRGVFTDSNMAPKESAES